MNTEQEDIDAILCAAIELASLADRQAYIERACGDDLEKRARVQQLVAAHFRAGPFLESPAPGLTVLTRDAAASRVGVDPGAMIGPFQVIEQIGEGGIGIVFLAQQIRPVQRKVALKVIKLGMDTRQVIARFEAERQALAMMSHPNVAKIFDAGATDAGRPYFAMELVEGVPVTEYCDQNSLSIERRLELFMQVCRALEHAHQKGLIHRDIKPGNVLVCIEDGRPCAKVIDFGIAKATRQQSAEKTMFTESRQLIGTPQYMSPEQAAGSLDIDTRTDVYSLGVLLYELLTGTTPFEGNELRSKAYSEMQRIICETDPLKPSTRLSKLKQLPSVAARRGTEPRHLDAAVRGELDWIVIKCLEKDRGRRYPSAAALAGDVQHYLSDEPVTAAAPSNVYRLRKFVRRNKWPVLAGSMILLLLVGGIIGTTIGLIGESRQRRIAEKERDRAEDRSAETERMFAIAEAVSKFQGDMFEAAQPGNDGENVTVVQVMTEALNQLDAGKLKDQPRAESYVRFMIGNTLRELGRFKEAESQLRRALEIERSYEKGPHWGIAQDAEALGDTLVLLHKLPEAEALSRESLQIYRAVLPADDPRIPTAMSHLGWVLQMEGKTSEAEPLYREALAIQRRILPRLDQGLTESLTGLAVLLAQSRRQAEAEPLFRETVEIDRAHQPIDPSRLAQSLNNLATLLQEEGKLAESEPIQREGLEMRRKAYPAGHPAIAQSLKNLGVLLQQQHRFADAEPLFLEAADIRLKAFTPDHPDAAGSFKVMIEFYTAWDKADPGKGHDAEAAHWQAQRPTTKAATTQSTPR